MRVRFRSVVADDFQAICDMISSEEELFLVYAQGKHPLTVEQVEALVEIRTEPTVMLLDDKVVGFGNFYGYKKGRSVVIGNVVIDPSLRGKGLGKLLVGHMIDLAFRKYDLPRVKIHVYNRNLSGLLSYISLGFKPYAMKARKDYKGDTVVLFTLALKRDAASL
jgi:ribosomal protein S18 acetylase RimI-like enzyme